MDVKIAFLNDFIEDEVNVKQYIGFEDTSNPNHIFKLKNALYNLKTSSQSLVRMNEKFSFRKQF